MLWRIVQGGIGAPVVPLANAIVLDSFPRRQAGLVSSIFGMTVVLGPVIGPTFGGMLAETYNWRWAFYMIVPAGALAAVARAPDPAAGQARRRARAGWTGPASWRFPPPSPACSSCCRAASGWTGTKSPEIIAETCIAALAFYVFLAHSLTAERPFLNLRLLLDRNYALGMLLVFIYGMLNFTPIVLLPSLLQQYAGYPDSHHRPDRRLSRHRRHHRLRQHAC